MIHLGPIMVVLPEATNMAAENLYCKVYVDTNEDREWLLHRVARQARGIVERRTVTSSRLVVDVMRNEDFDTARATGPDGFLFYRYYLDVLPVEGTERGSYVGAVGELLRGLRDAGAAAVASCDFEAELADPATVR